MQGKKTNNDGQQSEEDEEYHSEGTVRIFLMHSRVSH